MCRPCNFNRFDFSAPVFVVVVVISPMTRGAPFRMQLSKIVVVVVVVDVVVVCLLWNFSAAYELIVQSSLVLLRLLQNS